MTCAVTGVEMKKKKYQEKKTWGCDEEEWKKENKNEDRKNKRKGITEEDTLVVVSW